MSQEFEDDELKPEYDLSGVKVRQVEERRRRIIELTSDDDLLPEYDLDFSLSRPNRFAEAYKNEMTTQILSDTENDEDESSKANPDVCR